MKPQMVSRSSGLFEPDVVLAPQFFATLRRQAPQKKGEWRLLMAVLADAVDCFQKHLLARESWRRQLFREAEQWLMSDERRARCPQDSGPLLSFTYVCDVLGLEPEYLRRGLQRWRDEQVAASSTPAHEYGHRQKRVRDTADRLQCPCYHAV